MRWIFLAAAFFLFSSLPVGAQNLVCGSLSSPCQFWAAIAPASGTGNAQIVNTISGGFQLNPGNTVVYVPAITNTGAVTVNVDASGVTPVHLNGGAVPNGGIVAGIGVSMVYNGTTFDITSFSGVVAGASNLAGGAANYIPYQTGVGTTSFITPVNNAVLVTNGSGVPSESTSPNIGTATGTSLALNGCTIGSSSLCLKGPAAQTDTASLAAIGTNFINNGGFSGGTTGWVLGSGWAYGTNNVIFTVGSAAALTQSVSVVSGVNYLVTWTQTHSLANNGLVTVSLNGASYGGPLVYGDTSTHTNNQAIFTANTTGSVSLSFTAVGGGGGTITLAAVTIQRITPPSFLDNLFLSSGSLSVTATSGGIVGNTFYGYTSGASLTSGTGLTGFGYGALWQDTIGTTNSAFGYFAGYDLTTGNGNSLFGNGAGSQITNGNNNTAVGLMALESLSAGSQNTAVGASALLLQLSGTNDTAIGYSALSALTYGLANTVVGSGAGAGITSSNNNTVIGSSAMPSGTGTQNTVIGASAGAALTSGGANVILGFTVGQSTLATGSGNILIGSSSAVDVPTASTSNYLNIQNIIRSSGTDTPSTSSTSVAGSFSTVGPQTFGDGAIWGISGLSDASTYTTSSTPIFSFAPIWNFSSTSNGIGPIQFWPTMIPSGASAGNIFALQTKPIFNSGNVNVNLFRGVWSSPSITSGYTGTISTWNDFSADGGSNTGNPVTNFNEYAAGSITNGNGITTGTFTNSGLNIAAFTATAGSGGTVINNGVNIAMPTGVNAGTSTNCGLCISGNGQTGGATNYAINSTSTAQTNIASTAVTLPGLTTSTAALDYLCWNAGTGAVTGDSSGACLASREELKDRIGAINAASALWDIARLRPFWGKFKDEVATTGDHSVHAMLGAHQTEGVDPRLASYERDGGLKGVRYVEMSVVLVSAVQGLSVLIAVLFGWNIALTIKLRRSRKGI